METVMDERSYDIESRISRIEARLENTIEDITEMKGDLRTIRDVIVGGKGSMRVLMMMMGAAVALGGLVATWLPWFTGKP